MESQIILCLCFAFFGPAHCCLLHCYNWGFKWQKRWNQLREVLWESHFVCLLQLLLYHIPLILKSHKLHSGLEIRAGQWLWIWPVKLSSCRSKFNRIENEINLRFLQFSFYLLSRCVLPNFDMISWWHATRAVVYNSRIETDIGIRPLPVTKLPNISTFISNFQFFILGLWAPKRVIHHIHLTSQKRYVTMQKWIWLVIVTGDHPKIISSPDINLLDGVNCYKGNIHLHCWNFDFSHRWQQHKSAFWESSQFHAKWKSQVCRWQQQFDFFL